jgi:hypothetical protein
MPLWTDYHYNARDYWRLIAGLRNPNKYRYGLLLPKEEVPKIKSSASAGNKVLELPEGWLILTRKPKGRYYEYQDLERKPIKLIPFIIRFRPDIGRLSLQINRDYVRLQLKRARALSTKYWYGSKRKNEKDYIKAVNNLTRELRAMCRFALVYTATRKAYNRKLREIVITFLTSVLGLPKKVAKQKVEKYLIEF